MNSKKTTIAISTAVFLSIISFTGFQLTEIIAEETENKGYAFAEDVSITGEFHFRDGVEVNQFEVFEQERGFKNREAYVFSLEKIVGATPLLHKASDLSYFYRNSPQEQKTDYAFDANIIISKGGEQKRIFEYSRCYIKEYTVSTDFDKEEGWMGKGFAVKDIFEFECQSYQPQNPLLTKMQSTTDKAKATSSKQYQEKQRDYQQ